MLDRSELVKARNILAERGFERTVEEVADNKYAIEVLEVWKVMLEEREPMLERVNDHVDTGASLRTALEYELGTDLSDFDFHVWCDMIRIFYG